MISSTDSNMSTGLKVLLSFLFYGIALTISGLQVLLSLFFLGFHPQSPKPELPFSEKQNQPQESTAQLVSLKQLDFRISSAK